MSKKRFLSLALGAALVVSGSLAGSSLSATNLTKNRGMLTSSMWEARATETKETRLDSEDISQRLVAMVESLRPDVQITSTALPGHLFDNHKAKICEALNEDRNLLWRGENLRPHHLRSALSLQPHSIVACSFDRSGMKFTETGFLSAAAPRNPNLREFVTHYNLGEVRDTLDRFNSPSRDIDTTGTTWDDKKKIKLCRALGTDTSLRWGSRTFTPAQLRHVFSLQPASEVRCSYERGTMTLTELR